MISNDRKVLLSVGEHYKVVAILVTVHTLNELRDKVSQNLTHFNYCQDPASIADPGNETYNVGPGEQVNLLCLGGGNPTPTVDWTLTLGDRVINLISERNLRNVKFKVEVNSSGLYQCTVKNSLGPEAFKSFTLGK